MGLFNKERTDGITYDGQGEERKGWIDVVSYNGEADEIVWKFPHDNLSTATRLVVNDSQRAIFVQGGQIADEFGGGTHTLSTNNIPILQKLINLPFGGKSPFKAEVWYVNLIDFRGVEGEGALKFGTSEPVSVRDPETGIPVPIGIRGSYGIRVTDAIALLRQFVGTLHLLNTQNLKAKFKDFVAEKLSDCLRYLIKEEKIAVLDIESETTKASRYIQSEVRAEFERYGIEITTFNVKAIWIPKDNEGYLKLEEQKQILLEAKTQMETKQMEGIGEAARLAALKQEADMYTRERQLDIMETAAGNEGGAGQVMGAGMGLGMGFGVGGAFGQQMGNIAGVMHPQNIQVPPPPPQAAIFHVLINNAQYQYDLQTLGQYIQSGQITRDTLVWKAGMAQWIKAGDCSELQNLFGAVPPPPPPIV